MGTLQRLWEDLSDSNLRSSREGVRGSRKDSISTRFGLAAVRCAGVQLGYTSAATLIFSRRLRLWICPEISTVFHA